MNSTLRLCLAAFALPLAACSSLELAPGAEVAVASQYVWRGLQLDDRAVLQPDLFVEAASEQATVSVGAWGNVPLDSHAGDQGELTEIDLYVDYGRPIGSFDVSVGLVNYSFPASGAESTSEFHVTVAKDLGGFTAAVETWVDFVEAEGAYLNFNVSRAIEIAPQWELALLAGMGYMDDGQAGFNYGVDEAGFSEWAAQATLSHPLNDSLGLALIGAFSSVLDGDLRDAVDDPDTFRVAIGAAIGF